MCKICVHYLDMSTGLSWCEIATWLPFHWSKFDQNVSCSCKGVTAQSFVLKLCLCKPQIPSKKRVIVGHFHCHQWCHMITHVPMSSEGGRCNAGRHLGAHRRAESAISCHFPIKCDFMTSFLMSQGHWWCHFVLSDLSMMQHPCHVKNGQKWLTWSATGQFSWREAEKGKNLLSARAKRH